MTVSRRAPMRRLLLILAALGLVALAPTAHADEYIVRLDAGQDPAPHAKADASRVGGKVEFVYRSALAGYAIDVTPDQAAQLAAMGGVAAVEPSRTLKLAAGSATACPYNFCQFLPRGVDRIDGDTSSTKSGDGKGSVPVKIAVLDSGISTTHPDLNVVGGKDCTNSDSGYDDQGNPDFTEGHGTMVAGVIGARDDASFVVGVVPGARLYAVKVAPDQRNNLTYPELLCGIDWVTATRADQDATNDIAVANMSLGAPVQRNDTLPCGGQGDSALHEAICAMTRAGVVPVAAAGNDTVDLDNRVPARWEEVLTATAMEDFDGKPGYDGTIAPGSVCANITGGGDMSVFPENSWAFFSNYATLDEDRAHVLAAPGVCIPSTSRLAAGSYVSLAHGTSFAAPHAAGTVALCIASGACRGLTVPQIINKIVTDATAYSLKHPDYGYTGDPLRPAGHGYYGYLIRPGLY
jgi:subtilisin